MEAEKYLLEQLEERKLFNCDTDDCYEVLAEIMKAQKQPAMTLEEVKDEVAKRYGFYNWKEIDSENGHMVLNQEEFNKCYDEVAELYANQFREEQKWISVDSPYELMPAGLYLIQDKHPVTGELSISPILIKSLSRFPLGYETAYCKLEYPSPPNKEG